MTNITQGAITKVPGQLLVLLFNPSVEETTPFSGTTTGEDRDLTGPEDGK
jgi:hypothetical protein